MKTQMRVSVVVLLMYVCVGFVFIPNAFSGDRYKFKLAPVSFEIPWFDPFMEVHHKIDKDRILGDFEYYEIRNTVAGNAYILFYGNFNRRLVCSWYDNTFVTYEAGVAYPGLSPIHDTRRLCSSTPRTMVVYDYQSKQYTGLMQNYRVECYKLHTYKDSKGNTRNLLLVYHHLREERPLMVGFPRHYNKLCRLLSHIRYH